MNSDKILEQFQAEAPNSPYITGEYLRQLCRDQRAFIPVTKIPMMGSRDKWETLLICDDWQIQRRKNDHLIRILNPEQKIRALGKRKQLLTPILYHIHGQKEAEELRAQNRLKYGIVFCGGGAKGAFQLGVWKRLKELGAADHFTGISGASVGAMNTLLFAQGDYEKAESVWLSMKDGDLRKPNKKLLKNAGRLLPGSYPLSIRLLRFLSHWEENTGLFSTDKLEKIIQENISTDSLKGKLAYVSLASPALPPTSESFHRKRELFLKLNYSYLDPYLDDSQKRNGKKVLASAAMPVAYTLRGIDGRYCIDGGAMDNAPVCPLVMAGYRNILVVHLAREHKKGKQELKVIEKTLRKFTGKTLEALEQEGLQIHHIWPRTRHLGDILKIDPELTRMRINAGYVDACDQLGAFFSNVSPK